MSAAEPDGLVVLWALRSPCNLGCRYCYFGTIEDHHRGLPQAPGSLSHLSREDLTSDEVLCFAHALIEGRARRVFLAGGEPLIWPPVLGLVEVLTAGGVEVVVCTNGVPLNRREIVDGLLDAGVSAVSVSLDSSDPALNDAWRPARNGKDGQPRVLDGIRTLVSARGRASRPAVGVYTVLTARNLSTVVDTARLARHLGCDYFVPQPVSLAQDHPLRQTLGLTIDHLDRVSTTLDDLYAADLGLYLPDRHYPRRVLSTMKHRAPGLVRSCFGGSALLFVEPDGSIWDCPSSLRITACRDHPVRSVRDPGFALAAVVHPPRDCYLFSGDCVNMWPLMDFPTLQHPRRNPL